MKLPFPTWRNKVQSRRLLINQRKYIILNRWEKQLYVFFIFDVLNSNMYVVDFKDKKEKRKRKANNTYAVDTNRLDIPRGARTQWIPV